MIEFVCPKCNKILMVCDPDLVWDGDILMKSLCCDEHFYISYESEEKYLERRFKDQS